MMLPLTVALVEEDDIWTSPLGAKMRPVQVMSLPLNWTALVLQLGGVEALENRIRGE